MARQTKSWEVRVSWRRPDWKQGAFDTADYEVAADNEDDAKTIAWSAYCHEFLKKKNTVYSKTFFSQYEFILLTVCNFQV